MLSCSMKTWMEATAGVQVWLLSTRMDGDMYECSVCLPWSNLISPPVEDDLSQRCHGSSQDVWRRTLWWRCRSSHATPEYHSFSWNRTKRIFHTASTGLCGVTVCFFCISGLWPLSTPPSVNITWRCVLHSWGPVVTVTCWSYQNRDVRQVTVTQEIKYTGHFNSD